MEVLSPVKNLESAKVAINAGADAIYFSGDKFGARANARNSFSEVKDIVEYAKTHYVKTYATLNTLVMNDEIDLFIAEINLLHSIGVDAIIVQDISMISVITSMFDDIEVHCSTQMNIGNSLASKFVKSLGASRVVVPRELNFKQLQQIASNDIETEVFVHGALCTSYSGICLISSVLNKNSGNRGRCNQICRMPLELYKNGEKLQVEGDYLLSLKDLNVSDNLAMLQDINVSSIKIEGRLKQLDYVALTTYTYKSLLSGTIDNELYKVYNRKFTNGYIFSDSSEKLQNIIRVNNNGYYIGKVSKCSKGVFEITSDYQISHLDKIRFVKDGFENGQTIDVIENLGNNTYRIKTNLSNLENCCVYIVSNYNVTKRKYDYYHSNKKTYDLEVFMQLNEVITVVCNNKTYFSASVLAPAINKPVSSENIVKQFSKTKDYPFDFNINIEYCEGFIALKQLNEIRREIYADTTAELLKVDHQTKQYAYDINSKFATNSMLYVEVSSARHLVDLQKSGISLIIVITDASLLSYARSCGFLVYYKYSSVIEDEYISNYDDYQNFDGIIISEAGALEYFKGLDVLIISNYTFNTTNVVNQNFMLDYVNLTMLSHEICYDDLSAFDLEHAISFLYGKIDVMTMKYCVLNNQKVDKCNDCCKCRQNQYAISYNGELFNLKYTNYDKLALLSSKPLYNKKLLSYKTNYYVRFTDEADVGNLLNQILNQKISNYIDNYQESTK